MLMSGPLFRLVTSECHNVMPKQSPQESFADMVFPPGGVSLSEEFELQPEGTTPVGKNVRYFECLTGRGRGGSRPGLRKLIDEKVNG